MRMMEYTTIHIFLVPHNSIRLFRKLTFLFLVKSLIFGYFIVTITKIEKLQ